MASVVCQFVLCLLVADLVSGLVHWWEDTYGLPTWPVVGQLVIEPNIDHHLQPSAMATMWSLWQSNWQSVAAAAAVLAALGWAGWLTWQVAAVIVLAGGANEVHAWAHGARRGWPVRLLQEMCLVQTPAHHAGHHRPPYDRRFCTLTNWVNPLVDRLAVWRTLEWLLALAGVLPARGTAARRGV